LQRTQEWGTSVVVVSEELKVGPPSRFLASALVDI